MGYGTLLIFIIPFLFLVNPFRRIIVFFLFLSKYFVFCKILLNKIRLHVY